MKPRVDVACESVFVPFPSARRFELENTLESIWYPYKFCGVGKNKGPWGHVEGFMLDVEWDKVAVVGFNQ